MEYPNNMDNIYKNIEEYNPNQKNKILIVFDDMVADMINNKKLNSLVSELFIRRRELKFLQFLSLSHISRYQEMLN